MSRQLKSVYDRSVNFVLACSQEHAPSYLEARYVRRVPEKISAYVSSHNGCKMGCKMCYLTQLGQTSFNHSTHHDYEKQFDQVLSYYDKNGEERAKKVNCNFMARGEPLANKTVVNEYDQLFETLDRRASLSNLKLKVNISTIMPHTIIDHELVNIFGKNSQTEIYYSLYSIKPEFRKQWLPNAINYNAGLAKLKDYQLATGNQITLHWAYIKGHNDSVSDVEELASTISKYQLFGKVNLVRYNPPPNLEHTEEPDEEHLLRLLNIVNSGLMNSNTNSSKIIPRVGQDVYASCGMFIHD